MGVVYKARQARLGRVVALKMILAGGHAGRGRPGPLPHRGARPSPACSTPTSCRSTRSASTTACRSSRWSSAPAAVLEKKLAGTPLPPKEAAALVETLARAMQAAHEKGVIHRDLKPANVLLAEDGTPKITDFGLAKKLDEAGQTASGAVMGTPSYMAPEQAGGKTQEIGPACDVYALGAILYECLTGRPPFKAATALDTILQVVARRAGAAAAVAAEDAARPGDDLPEVPAEGAGQALRGRRRRWRTTCGGSWRASRSWRGRWVGWSGRRSGCGATRCWPGRWRRWRWCCSLGTAVSTCFGIDASRRRRRRREANEADAEDRGGRQELNEADAIAARNDLNRTANRTLLEQPTAWRRRWPAACSARWRCRAATSR